MNYRITCNNSPGGIIFQLPPEGGGIITRGGIIPGGNCFSAILMKNFLNFLFKFLNFFVNILQFLTKNSHYFKKNFRFLRKIFDF